MSILLRLILAVALAPTSKNTPHIKAAVAAYQEGKAAQEQHHWEPAMTLLQRAIEIEPTYLEAYRALIRVELDSGDRLKAAAEITRLLEIEPDAVAYRILLGQILLEQKEKKRALAQFSLALQRDPSNADALLGFAAAAKQSGMDDRADQAMKAGRQLYPADRRFISDSPH